MTLLELEVIGVKVIAMPQGRLRLEAAPGLLTAELLARIAQCKPLLLSELGCQREPVNLVNLDSYGQVAAKNAVCAGSEVHGAQAPHPQIEPDAWRKPASVYYAHHFTCRACQAAGRGDHYGRRCGTGMALWTAYQTAI